MTERIQCAGYDRMISSDLIERYRSHYADKNEQYCRSNRGHVQKLVSHPSMQDNGASYVAGVNEAKLAELFAINERIAAIQAEAIAAKQAERGV